MTWQTKKLGKVLFDENAISYVLHRNHISSHSRVFFKVSHNIGIKTGRNWAYWCAPEVDVIEVKKDKTIIAYEAKGKRRGRKRKILPENKPSKGAGFYDGIGQALAYLNLPYVSILEEGVLREFDKFNGGAFDFIYLVYARDEVKFPCYEKRIFDLLPIGVILASPNGKFRKVKEAPQNPLQNKKAKEHFLRNLDTLGKFSVNSKIFRKIKEAGEEYFQIYEINLSNKD